MLSTTQIDRVITEIEGIIGEEVVLGVETSANLLGLSGVVSYPITVVTNSNEIYDELNEMEHVEAIILTNPLVNSEIVTLGRYRCTSVERTILDLLRYDRNPQVIVESLAYYYHSVGVPEDWGNLPNLMRHNNLYEEFDSYIEDAEEYYDN